MVRASDLAGGAAHRRARAMALSADDMRSWFAPAFARWLQANFANIEAVAVGFGIRYQTARNWWNAEHRASGDTVALVFLAFPEAVACFLQEWEGR